MASAYMMDDEDIDPESEDDEEEDSASNVYIHINYEIRGIEADYLHHIKQNRAAGKTLQLCVHPNHGFTDQEQRDFLVQVVESLPCLEHIEISAPSHLFPPQRDTNTNGDWPVSLFTGLLEELRQQGRSLLSIRLSSMTLLGTFRHFQDWAHSVRRLTTLERFSLDKILLEKLPGALSPAESDEGCWMGPIVEALANLHRLQHVRILGASDFKHLSATENENGDETSVIRSEILGELCKSSSIRSLCLIHFNLTDDNVKHMAVQLQTNQSLNELDVDCTLGMDSSRALAKLLECNTTLKDLNLCVRSPEDSDDDDDMTDEQISMCMAAEDDINLPLAKGVGRSNLLNFALFRGHLSEKSQDAFRSMIVRQSSLTSLTLYCGDDAINDTLLADPVIQFYCKLNKMGRRQLLMSDQPHPNDQNDSLPSPSSVFAPELCLVDPMARVGDDLSCLFYLLSVQPSLCNRAIQKMAQDERVNKHKRKAPRRASSEAPTKRTRLYRAAKYRGVSYAD